MFPVNKSLQWPVMQILLSNYSTLTGVDFIASFTKRLHKVVAEGIQQ